MQPFKAFSSPQLSNKWLHPQKNVSKLGNNFGNETTSLYE